MKKTVIFLTLLLSLANANDCYAVSHVATITRILGETQIYHSPSKTLNAENTKNPGTKVLYEGHYYQVRDAKIGDQVQNGNILRTRPGAQANIIFDNGDQINLGPGSSYHIQWSDQKKDSKIKINLMYGRLRGIISKDGPRQKAIIKTRSATMGVRGTDFYISDSGPNGETEVTVLRGQVELKNEVTQKTIPVSTGMSALVKSKEDLFSRESTKEDLQEINRVSTIKESVSSPSETAQKVSALEKKALSVTLQDIKTYQPEIYKKIETETKSVASITDVNSRAVSISAESAPHAPLKKGKPRMRDLKDSDDEEVYKKYFNLNE